MIQGEKCDSVVTGCAGFIGSTLVDKLLELGHRVTGIDCFTDFYPVPIKRLNLRSAVLNPDFTLIESDIMDMTDDMFPDADLVFHLAAQPGVRTSWGANFKTYVKNNVDATQRLLEAYKGRKVTKLVYASSSSVYGNARSPQSESYLPAPISPYGVTKLAGEHLCRLYATNYRLPAVSLRYFTVYGERQRPDMAMHLFIQAITRGDTIYVHGDGEQQRDFTYAGDVVHAIVDLANSSVCDGRPVNVGGGHQVSVNNLVKLLEKITGKTAKVLHTAEVAGNPRETLADTSRLQKITGWSPRTTLKEGLKRQYDWYTSNEILVANKKA